MRPTIKVFLVLLFVFISLSLVFMPRSIAQEHYRFPDPQGGQEIFKEKSCQNCHAIRGEGGNVAKDLGRNEYHGSALDLAADLWNHSPAMREVMEELGIERPIFTQEEMATLVAYLYYQRYLKKTGDVLNGKKILSSKGCLNCHSLRGTGGSIASRLDRLPDYVSPLFMARAMWNHGPEMQKKMQELNIKWPKFEDEEIIDLTNYIRILGKDTYPDEVYYEPGNPVKGKELLKSKGCLGCHAIEGEGAELAPDFSELTFSKNVTEIAGLMWNHGSEMLAMMEEKKISWPKFEGNEMTDLMSFFYYFNFSKQRGDSQRGEVVFNAKGCGSCHSQEAGGIGPDLTKIGSLNSPIRMAQIMWNHAPNMETEMMDLDLQWPQFNQGEMDDLFTFLSNNAGIITNK